MMIKILFKNLKSILKNVGACILFLCIINMLFACKNNEFVNNEFVTDEAITNNIITDDTLSEFININNSLNKEVKVGDIVKYGVMAHDDYISSTRYDGNVVPMMGWKVLDVENGKALLISDKITQATSYNKIDDYMSTEYDYIFSDFEREGIVKVDSQEEKVFIPTKQIYDKYFGEMDKKGMNEKAISIASVAAKKAGLDISTNNDFGYYGAGSYWIKDEADNDKKMWVGEYGHLYDEIENTNDIHGLRPCIYVDVNHLVYEKKIYLGEYEQDNDFHNGREPIEWKLLEINGDKAILISKNILFCSIFDEKAEDRDYFYEESAIRKKLNNDFYNEAFNDYEKTLLSEHNYIINKDIHLISDETKEISDKVYILDSIEFDRYYKAAEIYAPPENLRFYTEITPYVMNSSKEGYFPDEKTSGMTYYSDPEYFWVRDLEWGLGDRDYQVIGKARNGKNNIITPRPNYRYGVRPCIEVDIEKIHNIIDENEDRIERINIISSNSEVHRNTKNNKNINKIIPSNDCILGTKYLNMLASINNYLKEKFNLHLDTNYYDVDEINSQITVKVFSGDTKYQGIMVIKYEIDDDGFTTNEAMVNLYDICDAKGVSVECNNKITLRNYELTILSLFNHKTIPIYEMLPIKEELIENIRVKLEEVFNDNYLYAIKSTVIDKNEYPDNLYGYGNTEPVDGDNIFEIDVVYDDKISRYEVKVNISKIDDKSYLINDINASYVKSFNVPGDLMKPKEFLKTEINHDFMLGQIYQKKITNETKQKNIMTYNELVDKTNINSSKSKQTNDLDNLHPVNKGQNADRHEFYPENIKFDEIKFGKYKNKKITWYVLSDESNQKLLISKYIIDNKSFSDKNHCFSWEDSSLREWINNSFYNESFNKKEKEKIVNVNLDYKNASGNTYYAQDKVFLLSENEYEKFFGGLTTGGHVNPYGIAQATDYAKNVLNDGEKLFVETNPDRYDEYSIGCSNYWLRNFSNDPYVSNITPIGQVLSEKYYENSKSGVRPCILINDKTIISDKENMPVYEERDKEVDEAKYEYLTTLGDKDLYMDTRSNIFTFEDDEKIIFGRLYYDAYAYTDLSDVKEYFFRNVYIDNENEKLYFVDESEKYIEGSYGSNYNSLVEIDKNLNKTKIAEKVYGFVILKDQVIYAHDTRNDVYSYKNGTEKKLGIGEHHYFIIGNNGENFCYAKERTANTNNYYKIEGDTFVKVDKLPDSTID